MKKNKSIHDLIDEVRDTHSLANAIVVDYWDADDFAVGFRLRNVVLYVSTYRHQGGSIQEYDYSIEQVDRDGNTIRTIVEMNKVRRKKLLEIMSELNQ